jgi:putative isomerase
MSDFQDNYFGRSTKSAPLQQVLSKPYINLLRNQLDFTRVPFSDRGSRLLIYQTAYQCQFYVKLAERLTSIDPGIETYLRRPPFIYNLHLIDAEGELIEFEVTSYPHMLYLNTRLGEFGLLFTDNNTITFGIPPEVIAGISFHVSPQLWKTLEGGGEFKSIRNLAYTTNGRQLRNEIVPEGGGYTVNFIVDACEDCTINLLVGADLPTRGEPKRYSEVISAAEGRWKEWFSKVPPVADEYLRSYAYAWWIMGNNLIKPSGSIAYEAMMPSKNSYVGLWLWDSAMHSLAFRHIDPELARNQIRSMLAFQLEDGMLPDAIYDEGVISMIDHPYTSEVTKPPILAWAALKLHETNPDLDFLKEIYIPLVRWNAWWFSQNDDDVDGLAQYNHPYSSGLDDNPLWDYGMPVESPDLNTYLCVQMGSLALMAEALGMEAESAMWRRRAKAIVGRMITDFWDEDSGIFRATFDHTPVPVVTPFNLYPLWTGQLPVNIRDALLAHLTNPEEFWGELAIPSVSRRDPHFEPDTMWRGPIWVNINYFFIEALMQAGFDELADTLRTNTLKLITNESSMHEYYNAETGLPCPKAADAFGWTASVFIDLAIAASKTHALKQQGLPKREIQ